jgi:hypothetical protein
VWCLLGILDDIFIVMWLAVVIVAMMTMLFPFLTALSAFPLPFAPPIRLASILTTPFLDSCILKF